MQNWFGILMSIMLIYPQVYPGYLMPEEKHNLESLKIAVSTSWILLFICIPILLLLYILFWTAARSHKKKKMDH